ncbi:MAG: rod shape-determining protein MreC [Fusobacteriota bacterium]
MKLNKKKSERRIYYIIFVVIIILFFAKNNLDNIENFINKLFYPIKTKIYKLNKETRNELNDLIYIKKVILENKKLRYENYILKLEKLKLEKLKEENERLKEILNLKKESDMNFIVANVVYRESMDIYRELIIDKGKKDSIKINMPVLHKDAIIGRVTDVYEESSKVSLITKHNFKISVLTENEKNLGILKGNNGKKLSLQNIIIDSKIKKGDKLISSGMSNIYPKGISVGIVDNVEDDENNIFKEIEVRLPYNILDLNEVMILTKGENEND